MRQPMKAGSDFLMSTDSMFSDRIEGPRLYVISRPLRGGTTDLNLARLDWARS